MKPPCLLESIAEGLATEHHGQDLIPLMNLLHLIGTKETKMLVKEISKALASNGLSIYKFVRSGKLMSKNDVEFHNNLKVLILTRDTKMT